MRKPEMRLANKVAIITGAGLGIGRGIAYLFAQEGAKIVVANRHSSSGEETVATIRRNGGQAIFLQTNVTVASEVEHLVKATKDEFGKIDILVNSAGIRQGTSPVEDVDESVWDRVYSVNVKGIFLATKYVVPEMKKAGFGVIINIGSIAAVRPGPSDCVYISSKGAVITLTKALAIELASANIRVNCINPSLTETRMLEQFPEEVRKIILSRTPLGRIIKPEEVAHAALYLASDESSMLTGTSINVDGGNAIWN